MSYAATAAEIAALPQPDTQRADLVRLSDALLDRIEQLNLADTARLPAEVAETANQVLVETDLLPRWLHSTAGALEAVYAAQRCLFGQGDEEEEEGQPCGFVTALAAVLVLGACAAPATVTSVNPAGQLGHSARHFGHSTCHCRNYLR